MHLKGDIFEKLIFLKTFEAIVIILTCNVLPNMTMGINKFQRPRLTFDLSAKVAHIGVPLIYYDNGYK